MSPKPPNDWSPSDNLYAVAVSETQRWTEAADLTAQRIRSGDPFQQQLDARLFLLALRQLLYAADLQQDTIELLAPNAQEALRAARADFDRAVPGLTDARNVLVHFADYARGAGREQKKLIRQGADLVAVARNFWPFGYDPRTGKINLGPYQIEVGSACIHAKQLCMAVWMAARAVDAYGVPEQER